MARAPGNKRGSPLGALLLGSTMLSAAFFGPGLIGAQPDAADQLYLGVFKFMGGLGVLTGVSGMYNTWLNAQKRTAAEVPSDTYGDAAFATLDECEAAGLLEPKGLFVGMLEGQPLFFPLKAHMLTIGPARSGKGTDVVIPQLLHCPDSMVVMDVKGELAASTGQHRASHFGHEVFYYNPWGLHGLPQHRIDPLQVIKKFARDPRLVAELNDKVDELVLQLIPEPEDQRNRFWREGSRAIIAAVILYLVLERAEIAYLPEVYRTISSPRRLERAIASMMCSEELGGLLADLGDDLDSQIKDTPEQFSSFRTGAAQPLKKFRPESPLGVAVSGSDFDLEGLGQEPITVFIIFPPDKIATHGEGFGPVVNQAILVVAYGDGNLDVLFMLDEFANLGKLSGLAESLTALPGLGARLCMIVQEPAELTRIYGPHTATTIFSQSEVVQILGIKDSEFAKKLSEALGQKTVKTINHNLGRFDDDEVGQSMSETGQPLIRQEDLLNMGRSDLLLLIDRIGPVWAKRFPFWFVHPWASWASDNPVEGPVPVEEPRLRLEYKPKGGAS